MQLYLWTLVCILTPFYNSILLCHDVGGTLWIFHIKKRLCANLSIIQLLFFKITLDFCTHYSCSKMLSSYELCAIREWLNEKNGHFFYSNSVTIAVKRSLFALCIVLKVNFNSPSLVIFLQIPCLMIILRVKDAEFKCCKL